MTDSSTRARGDGLRPIMSAFDCSEGRLDSCTGTQDSSGVPRSCVAEHGESEKSVVPRSGDAGSAFQIRLSHYIDLDRRHLNRLAKLESRERELQRGDVIYVTGDEDRELYIVKSGWFVEFTLLPDGGRHVIRILQPGDVIGFASLAYDYRPYGLKAATDGRLAVISHDEFNAVFLNEPVIGAQLLAIVIRDSVVLADALRATSRMNPRARIAYFLLELISRLRLVYGMRISSFDMPLTQSEVGDAMGLTNVTVSRALRVLEDDGLIARSGRVIELLQENLLEELCDFRNRHCATRVESASQQAIAV